MQDIAFKPPRLMLLSSTAQRSNLATVPDDIAGDAVQLASNATAYQKEQADAGNPISISQAVEHASKGAAN